MIKRKELGVAGSAVFKIILLVALQLVALDGKAYNSYRCDRYTKAQGVDVFGLRWLTQYSLDYGPCGKSVPSLENQVNEFSKKTANGDLRPYSVFGCNEVAEEVLKARLLEIDKESLNLKTIESLMVTDNTLRFGCLERLNQL